jgi:hypothetical protein
MNVVGIDVIKRMPILAVSLTGVFGTRADSAQSVLPVSDGLQMGRIHTAPISAQMVYFQTLWNRINHQLINRSVSNHEPTVSPYASVARAVGCGLPFPASLPIHRNEHLLPQPLFKTAASAASRHAHPKIPNLSSASRNPCATLPGLGAIGP